MIISRWHDHTIRMASGVPMPAPRGSPAGPNQWFWGAPVAGHEFAVSLVELGTSFKIYITVHCGGRRAGGKKGWDEVPHHISQAPTQGRHGRHPAES